MRKEFGLVLAAVVTSLGIACSPAAPAVSLTNTAESAGTATPAGETATPQPICLTTMTHMEGGWRDDVDEGLFLRHVEEIRWGMDLFDEYGAKMTVESEKEFARANTTWGLNILQEVVDRGHGVGTHCDIGFRDDLVPVEDFAALLKENKDLVDALVGEENNRGCSGAGGKNDWAVAADLAGFDYVNGIVGMHYLSMPIENRPSEEWTDGYIYAEGYHSNAPVDLDQRVYPFAVADATDFEADEDALIVVSSGEMGLLAGQAELAAGKTCRPECVLTPEDIETAVAIIRDIDSWRVPERVAKVTFYLPVYIFEPEYEDLLRMFLEAMQDLEDEGIVQWATQGEVYDAYVAEAGEPGDLDRTGIVAADTSGDGAVLPPAGGPKPPREGTLPPKQPGALPPKP